MEQKFPQPQHRGKKNEKMKIRRNYSCGPDADNMKKALDYIAENPESSRIEVAKKFYYWSKTLSEGFNGERNVEARVGEAWRNSIRFGWRLGWFRVFKIF